MHFFGLVFWLVVAWLAFRMFRRWGACSVVGTRGYARVGGGWYDSSEFYAPRKPGSAPQRRAKTEGQQEYIDALESRVNDLEERLDFTERLLSGRQDSASVGKT
jgi:hypothetical protein